MELKELPDLPEAEDELPELPELAELPEITEIETAAPEGGRQVSREYLQDLSSQHGVPVEDLEKQAVRLGATYPDSTTGEKLFAKAYNLGDNLTMGVPSWIAKKVQDEKGEAAFDALKNDINERKTWDEKAVDIGQEIVSPAGAISKIGKGLKGAIATGAAAGGLGGLTASDDDKELWSTLVGMGAGGVFGGLFQQAGKLLAKGGAKILGRGSDVSDPYLANPEKYQDLKFEDVQDEINTPLQKLIDDAANAKSVADDAKGASTLDRQAFEARLNEEYRTASNKALAAEDNLRQSLREVDLNDDAAGLVDSALAAQRGKTTELAKRQADLLRNTDAEVSLQPLYDDLRAGLESRRTDGIFLPGDEQVARYQALLDELDQIRGRNLPPEKGPGAVPVKSGERFLDPELNVSSNDAPTVKTHRPDQPDQLNEGVRTEGAAPVKIGAPERVLDPVTLTAKSKEQLLAEGNKVRPQTLLLLRQSLQDRIYDSLSGSSKHQYSSGDIVTMKRMLGKINEQLDGLGMKSGDESYDALRKELAENTQLSEAALEQFGRGKRGVEGDAARRSLKSVAGPDNADKLELLRKIDKDGKIMAQLQPYIDAQAKLGNPVTMKQLASELPEVAEAEAHRAMLSDPVKMSKLVESRPLAQEARAARSQADEMAARRAEVGNLSPDNSQAAIRRVMHAGPKKPETQTREQFDALSKYAGKDLLSQIEDLRVASAFTGGGPNGSRLVQGVSNMLAPAGRTAQSIGTLAALGADYTTGRIAKGFLDLHLKTKSPVALMAGQVAETISQSPYVEEKYGEILSQAAEKGPEAFMAIHQTLMKTDPEYANTSSAE